MRDNSIGNVELKVTLRSENISNEAIKIFKDCQKEVDKNTITYKIAGDKSRLMSTLKEMQGFTPDLLTKIKLDFDKSDYDKKIDLLKGVTGKSAKEIGVEFKKTINESLKTFNMDNIIGKKTVSTADDVKKLKDEFQSIMDQTKSISIDKGQFKVSDASNIEELEEQAIALNKIKIIFEALSKYRTSIRTSFGDLDLTKMLDDLNSKDHIKMLFKDIKQNEKQIDSAMSNIGNIIKSNASKWAIDLESIFNNEFNDILSLFNQLQDVINGTYKQGTGGSGNGNGGSNKVLENLSRQLDEVDAKIRETESELDRLNSESSKPKKKQDPEGLLRKISNRSNAAKYNLRWNENGGKNSKEVKEITSLIQEYMEAGGLLEKLGSDAKYIVESLGIKQITPQVKDVSNEIDVLKSKLEEYKNERAEILRQQEYLKSKTQGESQGDTGSPKKQGDGTPGTPTTATVSPELDENFKQKLQEQVNAIGAIDVTIGSKLSETFKADIQTEVDNIGKVDVGVSFSSALKEGEKKQEIPVDVTTTPKLSETFKSDLQKLIDEEGKYNIEINADSNNQNDIVPIKVTLENGEELRNQLKSEIEGENGLNVKVNPIIDDDFKLEINNAVLKDVKVDGTISGGNLKLESIEAPVNTSAIQQPSDNGETPVVPVSSVKKELEDVKQKHEEVGQAAQKSGEVQKLSLLEVVKKLERVKKKHDEVKAAFESGNSKKIDISEFAENKRKEIEKEYTQIDDLTKKIQKKIKDRPSGEKATVKNTAQYLSAMIMYVERLQTLMGSNFSFDILGENGEQKFNFMKTELDKLTGATKVSREEFDKWHLALERIKAKKLGLEKTATEAEILEVKIYNAVKALEKLKANKKDGLINIDLEKFKSFWSLWSKYKSDTIGGKLEITDFTNESKVINTVKKAYTELQKERKASADRLKLAFKLSHTDIDINQFNSIFEQIESGALTSEQATEKLEEAIKSLRKELEKPVEPVEQPEVLEDTEEQKNKKDKGKETEIGIKPKIEDPVAFANEVTEQLKGQSAIIDVVPKIDDIVSFENKITEQLKDKSATIDVKPNIVWEKVDTVESNNIQNTELDKQIEIYSNMIKKMQEYINLQKEINQGNFKIADKFGSRSPYVKGEDTTKASGYTVPTGASLKRKLDEYLADKEKYGENSSNAKDSKDILAAYTLAFNNVDKAQQIFGKNNKALFSEIQVIIENAIKSMEAFNAEGNKFSSILSDAVKLSTNDTISGKEYNKIENILKTGDIDKTVKYLQKVLGLQIPQATQQAKTAIEGIGEQIRQESNEVSQTPILIEVEADITSLNSSIQSKKEQILPVDVNLSANIESLNTSIQTKKAEILPVDINVAVNKETIENLNTLDIELGKIVEKIQKIIEKPVNVTVDYSSIQSLYEIGEDGASPIDKLKTSIDGLQTGVLYDLKNAFQGFSINKDLASRIEEVAKSLSVLKITLNNVDHNSTGFLNTIKELSSQADGLRNLATVIKASKEEIQKAKDEINNTSKKSNSKSQATDKEKYSILKNTLNEILRLTKEYNKEKNDETKSEIYAQIQLYKDRADTLQLELWDLEKINEIEQNRIDIIQDKIKLEERKQENKELALLEKQINAEEKLEAALIEQEAILSKDSNEWKHALDLLSLYEDKLKDIVKITRNVNMDRNTGFQAISYQFTDTEGSTTTIGANGNLLVENTKVADLNDLYSKLKRSANEYYALQVKILNGDTSTKTQTDSLIAYNNMIKAQKDILYWKEKGLVPSQEQLQIEERIIALAKNYQEQEQKTGLDNMYKTVLNTLTRLNEKQKEVNDLRLKADGTKEFNESIQNAQNNVSLLIGTLRGFTFGDFFSEDALSSLGLKGSSLLFDNKDLNSLKWVISQLPLTEKQINAINDALDKNTLIKEKNIAAQNEYDRKHLTSELNKEQEKSRKDKQKTYSQFEKEQIQAQANAQKELNTLIDEYIAKRNTTEISTNKVVKAEADAEAMDILTKIDNKITILQNADLITESQIKEALSRIETFEDELSKRLKVRNNAQLEIDLTSNLEDQVKVQKKIYELESKIATSSSPTAIAGYESDLKSEQNKLELLQKQANEYYDIISKEKQMQYVAEQTADALEKKNNIISEYEKTEDKKIAESQQKKWEAFQKEQQDYISNQWETEAIERNRKAYQELTDTINEYAKVSKRIASGNMLDGDIEDAQKLEEKISKLQKQSILSPSQIDKSERLLVKLYDELDVLERKTAKEGVDSFNKKTQSDLYDALSEATKGYVRWLKEESSVTGDAQKKAKEYREEYESLINSLKSDIKSYGLQDLEKELELDRKILEIRKQINYQDEVATSKMAENSYDREYKLEERKNKLQINSIGADSKTVAKNNVRIADIDNLIKKEQEYRQAMGLEGKAHEASVKLINKKATLTHNLTVEQNAYNESVKASTKEKLSKESYDKEISYLERINKLEIDNITASKTKQAENNEEIRQLKEKITQQQLLRKEQELNTEEGNQRITNKESELKDNLDGVKGIKKAGKSEASKQWVENASRFKDQLKGALEIYENATDETRAKATELIKQLNNSASGSYNGIEFKNINQSNVDSVIKKIESDANKIIEALKKQDEKVKQQIEKSENIGTTASNSDKLSEAFKDKKIGKAKFSKVKSVDSKTNRAIIEFVEELDDKVRITTLTIEDMEKALRDIQNGSFNIKDWGYDKTGDWQINQVLQKETDSASKKIDSLISDISSLQTKLTSSFKGTDINTSKFLDALENISKKYKEVKDINDKNKTIISDKDIQKLREYLSTFENVISQISLEKFDKDNKTEKFVEKLEEAKNQLENVQTALKKVESGETFSDDDINQVKEFISMMRELYSIDGNKENNFAKSDSVDKYLKKTYKILEDNTAMADELKHKFRELAKAMSAFENGKMPADEFENFRKTFHNLEAELYRSGKTGLSFFDGIFRRAKSMSQSFISMYLSLWDIVRYVRTGVTYIKELDTALTEMKKVSDESVQSLKNFQNASFDIANSVGTTAVQIQNSTADFMRLGESLDEAAESAKTANILLNVSEFESIDAATESLVSMSAAYSELEKIDIVDKLNLIGNNFAISTDGLASALQRSASALKTAGNDIDEAIALVTAGNQVVQDPESVGAGLRTIALRITGTESAKEELEELGEDTSDFLVQTSAKSQQAIKDFTKVASNNFEGFDILDDNGNFKSTYEILLGISEIYEEIVKTDKQYGSNMANGLLETLAGKIFA